MKPFSHLTYKLGTMREPLGIVTPLLAPPQDLLSLHLRDDTQLGVFKLPDSIRIRAVVSDSGQDKNRGNKEKAEYGLDR